MRVTVNQPKAKGAEVLATYSLDRGLGQPCHQFLNVADTLSTSDWRPKPGTVPKLQVIPTEDRFELHGEANVVGGIGRLTNNQTHPTPPS